jgi:hypothetical protein
MKPFMILITKMGGPATLLGLLVAFTATACAQDKPDIPDSWATDCVGHMQINLPSNADVAAMPPKDFIKEFEIGSNQPIYLLPSGERAGRSSSDYAGKLLISLPLSKSERAKVWVEAAARRARNQIYLNQHGKPFFKGEHIETSRLAWHGADFYAAVLSVGDSAIFWEAEGAAEKQSLRTKRYQTIASGLKPRPSMTSPAEPGVCLPYAFIRDDDDQPFRSIGIVYQLRDHPDITVFLQDRSAEVVSPSSERRPETYTPSYKLNDFWAPFGRDGGSYRSVWFPPGRDIKLAGYEGKAAFVEFTHSDGSVDYGYTVAVRGDPDSKEDKPDLFLYVLRHAALAKAKGIEPVSKEALLKMAETIAASVKRRPVKQ